MSSLPPPPALSPRANKRMPPALSTISSSSYHINSSSLPPPPNVTPQKQHRHQILSPANGTASSDFGASGGSDYAQNLARSMTIDEMRNLHRRAISDAESKQTELRLVLASRYRELVGSSDEVTKMRERAQELDELVSALPTLMGKLLQKSENKIKDDSKEILKNHGNILDDSNCKDNDAPAILKLRQNISFLPRLVHRSLDKNMVYEATDSLIELFRLIAEQTDEYPLATALSTSSPTSCTVRLKQDILLQSQMRMTFLHVQTLPVKIARIAKKILNEAASFSNNIHRGECSGASVPVPKYGAQRSAAALSALDMLTIQEENQRLPRNSSSRPIQLLDIYFDAKGMILRSLLDQLSNIGDINVKAKRKSENQHPGSTTINAEEILSKIVLILQYDIILHPYQIFVLRKFPTNSKRNNNNNIKMMNSLPIFPAAIVQTKASNFLSAHLPLIRTKVKGVLIDIAGTTASALGQIRQSLYDKTDGVECTERLDDSDGICAWDEAVSGVVDVQSVLVRIGGVGLGDASVESSSSNAVVLKLNDRRQRFSLWAVLFSNTFSSLVHSLLTSSFQSVHTKLVSTLRLSLTNAPPIQLVLPHEAYRNTLNIASQLDSALVKVSDDAHELLVHAEERVESERRLRQSLYVQTCEIMGRLICELRRMMLTREKSDKSDGVKHLIIGRLCHLLKFRLTALSTLLDPKSSPAVLHHGGGVGSKSSMISIVELSSAFELADDDDDGLITFQEAIEAVDSAFSGTHFHGAEMVRETLLLPASGRDNDTPTAHAGIRDSGTVITPQDVTLDELTLLLARGLRHDKSGGHSALGAIQNSLDRMVDSSFQNWAKEVFQTSSTLFSRQSHQFIKGACMLPEEDFQRMFTQSEVATTPKTTGIVTNVSPHITSFLINISFALNRSICPSDSLLPVPYKDYAVSMGVDDVEIPRMIDVIRGALLRQGLEAIMHILDEHVRSALEGTTAPLMKESGPSGIAQLKNDLSFIQTCFSDLDQQGFCIGVSMEPLKEKLQDLIKKVDILFRRACNISTAREIEAKQEYAVEAFDLFISCLLGENKSVSTDVTHVGYASTEIAPQTGGKTPLFHPPLTSSCRFQLLPIQADRTLGGVQTRGKYKEKEESNSRSETVGSGAVRAGLGFFSSMLKTS